MRVATCNLQAAEPLAQLSRRGRVAVVTLNRPKALNALNPALISAMNGALREAEADSGVPLGSAHVFHGATGPCIG